MEKIKTAEVLCVGTEILIGDIVNTDAAFISERLSALGISQYHQSVVGDNPERLARAVRAALRRCDLVILTGGLGPTYDDLTKETVAQLAGVGTALHEPSLGRIKEFFEKLGVPMTSNNIKQAMLPEGATVFPNDFGTAPGMALTVPASAIGEGDGGEPLYSDVSGAERTVILLPGPPHELVPMFERYAQPYLSARCGAVMLSRNVGIFGLGESAVEDVLAPMMKAADNPTVAPYCGEGQVRLRVTARAGTEAECAAMCDSAVDRIKQTSVGRFVYGVDRTLEEAVISEAAERGLRLSAAESCTGGLVCGALTSVSGSSAVFDGGAVTYSNEMKMKLLGVKPQTLESFGAVSRQTAAEMALGALRLSGADIAVSLTGIAGPGGGTEEKPVGLVYIAVASRAGLLDTPSAPLMYTASAQICDHFAVKDERGAETDALVLRCMFAYDRDRVRTMSVRSALAALLSAVRASDGASGTGRPSSDKNTEKDG